MLLALLACASPDGSAPRADAGAPGADDTGAPRLDPGVTLDAPGTCEAPRDAVSYVESGAALGLTGPDTPDSEDRTDGGGLVADDLDGDGDLDLALTHQEDDLRVFTQVDGRFVETRVPGATLLMPILVDLDADGRRDLVVGGKPDALVLRNTGDALEPVGTFVSDAGVLRGGVPADLDGDGDEDLVALRRSAEGTGQDTVLWNDGGFVLREATVLEAADAPRMAFDAAALDWDDDGAPDVYVANDMGPTYGPNVLWNNGGDGTFADASEACACGRTMSAMGVSLGDYERDGDPDLYVTGVSDNVLFAGAADGAYVDTTRALGADPVDDDQMAWGSAWLDHDNDGALDLAVAEGDFGPGHVEGEPVRQPFRLLRQEDGVFTDVSAALRLDRVGLWRGVLPADLNGDGVLDLLVQSHDERPHVWLSEGCTAAAWIAVEAPTGSRVRVTAGGETWTGWATGHPGYAVATAPHVWFGLGDVATVDRIEVTLPWSGGTRVAEGPLAPRRWVRVGPG